MDPQECSVFRLHGLSRKAQVFIQGLQVPQTLRRGKWSKNGALMGENPATNQGSSGIFHMLDYRKVPRCEGKQQFFRDFKKIERTDAWLFGGMGDPRFTKRSKSGLGVSTDWNWGFWSVKSPELDASAGYCSHVPIPKTKSIKGYSVLSYQVLTSWSPCNQDF
jgi:hypothetical protein